MRSKILNSATMLIENKYDYNETRIKELYYGLNTMYTLVTKLLIFALLSFMFGIFKEFIIYLFFYNFLRMYGCGFHANTNFQCWLLSFINFIIIPYIATIISLNLPITLIIGVLSSLILIRYAPADTQKKPIINPYKRKRKKIYMFLTCFVYLIIIIYSNNILITNLILLSIIMQTLLINPIIYKLFNQTFNNYLYYRNL